MTLPAEPEDPATPRDPAEPSLQVAVERSGGFAGLTRRWSVTASAEQEHRWLMLIEECPWTGTTGAPDGADRFCWTVTAVQGEDHRTAVLAEHEVDGPWRTLIDAVRDASH